MYYQARSQGFEKGVQIFPSTIVIEQRSGEGGRCGRGCPPPAIGGFGGPPHRQFWKWNVKSCILVTFYLYIETELIEHFYMKFHLHWPYSVTDRHEYDITYMYSPLPFFNNHHFRLVTEIHYFIRCLNRQYAYSMRAHTLFTYAATNL